MSKRGVLLGNEFRYLQPSFSGELTYDVIFKDKETKDRRYALSWKHFQRLGRGGPTLGVDYQRVSDNDYISDFSTTIRESSENILNQKVWLSYGKTYWSTSLGVYKIRRLLRAGADRRKSPMKKFLSLISAATSRITTALR